MTNEYIFKTLRAELRQHLHHPYAITYAGEFEFEVISDQPAALNKIALDVDDFVAITNAFDETNAAGFIGVMLFNFAGIRKHFDELGYFDSMKFLKGIVHHECRHVEQFEFLRERGGPELLRLVSEDQKCAPYLLNLFEMDAYHYQFTGNRLDLSIVFAKYL